MKTRKDDALDPQVERDLAAIDAALRGEAVDHDLADLAELSVDLSEMTPSLEESFAADLDARAAAGFEAGERRGGISALHAAWDRFRAVPLTRRLMPVGVAALGAVVVSTAVVALKDGGGGDASTQAPTAISDSGAGSSSSASKVATGAVGGGSSGAAATEAAPVTPLPVPAAPLPNGGSYTESKAPTPSQVTDQYLSQSSLDIKPKPSGPYASGQNHRAIERDAQITLGTDPDKVQSVSDAVLGVVGRYQGIVLNSSVRDGPAGDAGAQFGLLIPSDRLSDALADLSAVAEVRSREENTKDITAPTVTTQEHLRDARAEVEGLLKQLARADTDAERRSAEGQLAFQRQRIARLRSTLSSLSRRANLSKVTLEIVTGDASSFGAAGGGRWTIGDALGDSGNILGTAAGITLIGLAILAPFALLALLVWLFRRAFVSQSRRRALEG